MRTSGLELVFLWNILLCLIAGFFIGIERRASGKPAGVSTHCFVIAGAMIFSMISFLVDATEPGRIAGSIITGVGFLGAGIILHHREEVLNLTTAASIWLSAAIGMAIGFQYYWFAIIGVIFSLIVPKISHYVKVELEKHPHLEHHGNHVIAKPTVVSESLVATQVKPNKAARKKK
jgi:putative Mg2+ transporter-C (MgtC) family protein